MFRLLTAMFALFVAVTLAGASIHAAQEGPTTPAPVVVTGVEGNQPTPVLPPTGNEPTVVVPPPSEPTVMPPPPSPDPGCVFPQRVCGTPAPTPTPAPCSPRVCPPLPTPIPVTPSPCYCNIGGLHQQQAA